MTERRAEPPPPAAAIGRAELMALLDNTSAVIYMRGIDGRYLLVNREYERLFGVSRKRIVGLTDHDLFPPEVADTFRANDLAAVADGAPQQVEETASGRDGQRTYLTVKFPIRDRGGRAYAVAGISTDITDRKRAQEEVQRLNAELARRVTDLEAATEELDAFAYSVSHDLRAPLRSLAGFSQLLLEDYPDRLDATGQDYLRRLQANVVRMGRMIDNLLDLARTTRVEFQGRPIDLSEIARGIVAELRSADPDRKIDISIADRLPDTGDPLLVRIMLTNLLTNAWKFTAKKEAAAIEVGSMRSGGERVHFVRDNGAGFDRGYADKLFEPFQRLHRASEFDGQGLGLAIVRRIARRHGGRVWADGEPGQGATFYFTLTPQGH